MSRKPTRRQIAIGLVLVLALGLPFVGPRYLVDLAILSLIFAIMAVGLNILMGYTGLDSLGQAAFYGTSAYTLGVLTAEFDIGWVTAAAVALVGGTLLAALIGLIAVRLRGLLFLLVTLAFGQLLWGVANRWGSITGGANGLSGVSAPSDLLRDQVPFYYLTLALFVGVFIVVRVVIASPFGLTLRAIREQEIRSSTLGYNTYWHAYVAFVIAGFLASLAGILGASYNRFVSLRDLSLELSFESMLMVIFGGAGTVFGPVIGAVGLTVLRYVLSITITDWWPMVLGGLFVLATVYLPNGLTGLAIPKLRGLFSDSRHKPPPDAAAALEPRSSRPAVSGTALTVTDLSKRFGDLEVLRDVAFRAEAGERIGVIGLNGAGKTTLFHLLSGIDEPSDGVISMFGTDITSDPAHRRAALGMTRTFQITKLYPKLTVRENLLVALMGWTFRHLRFVLWRPVGSMTELNAAAAALIERVRLTEVSEAEVRHLSYGHQRQLEIALALAGEPRLLLLDEPTAGLAHAEIDGMQQVLAALPEELTVLLVEHHLEVIFQLVDRVLVLHQGTIIADGEPGVIKNDETIRNLYFGIGTSDPAAGES